MKAVSKVVNADKTHYTLRTSVPADFVQKMKINAGDQLEWELKEGAQVATVKKIS